MPDDPDQSDVSQDPTPDLDEAEHAALLATAGGLTAHQILTWEASQIGQGEHPPGSNHTTYSVWGDGPWCFYFQSYAFRKYNALDLIHGAHGYVPDFKGIFSPHGEFHTGSPKAGDLVAFDFNGSGDPEHIGIVEKVVSGSTIQTIEGNTSDKVMRRTRSRSYVYGYATPKYGSTPTPTPIGDDPVIGLKRGDKGEAVKGLQTLLVYAGQAKALGKSYIDGEYGASTAEALRLARVSTGSKGEKGSGDKVTGWAYGELIAAVARTQSKS
jgi:hypothetical protein